MYIGFEDVGFLAALVFGVAGVIATIAQFIRNYNESRETERRMRSKW